MEIRVADNQIEKATRHLKRKMAREGVLKELKKKLDELKKKCGCP